eukprot:51432-Eustigmatos_ZCMA.PRE.1
MHQGKAPRPLCISTLALLGALGSAVTAQRALPLPVTPQDQSTGAEPMASLSKLIPNAMTGVVKSEAAKTAGAYFIQSLCHSDGTGGPRPAITGFSRPVDL